MSKNDITGDKIATRTQNTKFDNGYDRIWGKKESKQLELELESTNEVHPDRRVPGQQINHTNG